MSTPVLSIVIVDSGGIELTLPCLASIYQNPPQTPFEIILVDNFSQKPLKPIVEAAYPDVRIFRTNERQGFSKNYNLGMRQATGVYVVILNNDTLVKENAFDEMMGALQADTSCAMVGPKLLGLDGEIQTGCARPLPDFWHVVLYQLGIRDFASPIGLWLDKRQRKKLAVRPTGPVPCIMGACMMLSKEKLDEVGMLDEGFHFYFEDVEWAYRVQQNGYEVVYVAEAEIIHLGDQTGQKLREWGKQNEYLGCVRYFSMAYQYPRFVLWLVWLSTLFGFWMRATALIVGKEREQADIYRRLRKWLWGRGPAYE
jgi:GT2 family glycosyltransferase